jgi:hypothetical protein
MSRKGKYIIEVLHLLLLSSIDQSNHRSSHIQESRARLPIDAAGVDNLDSMWDKILLWPPLEEIINHYKLLRKPAI